MSTTFWIAAGTLCWLIAIDIIIAWKKPRWIWEWDLAVGVIGLLMSIGIGKVAFDADYRWLFGAAVLLAVLHVLRIGVNLRMRWRERKACRTESKEESESAAL